jgi:hypothetical protein
MSKNHEILIKNGFLQLPELTANVFEVIYGQLKANKAVATRARATRVPCSRVTRRTRRI